MKTLITILTMFISLYAYSQEEEKYIVLDGKTDTPYNELDTNVSDNQKEAIFNSIWYIQTNTMYGNKLFYQLSFKIESVLNERSSLSYGVGLNNFGNMKLGKQEDQLQGILSFQYNYNTSDDIKTANWGFGLIWLLSESIPLPVVEYSYRYQPNKDGPFFSVGIALHALLPNLQLSIGSLF